MVVAAKTRIRHRPRRFPPGKCFIQPLAFACRHPLLNLTEPLTEIGVAFVAYFDRWIGHRAGLQAGHDFLAEVTDFHD